MVNSGVIERAREIPTKYILQSEAVSQTGGLDKIAAVDLLSMMLHDDWRSEITSAIVQDSMVSFLNHSPPSL